MRTFTKAFYFPLLFLILFTFNIFADGLTGTYYNNNSFTSPSTLTRVDSTINFEWGSGSPDGALGNDNYTVEWKGYIYLPEDANYIFSLAHDDVMVLSVDGVELYNNSTWTGGTNTYGDAVSTYYTAGYYPIILRFTEWGGGAYAKFAWRNDASIGTRTIVPTTNLFTSVITDYLKAEYSFDECSWNGVAGEVENSVGVSSGQSYNGASVDKNDSILCTSASFDGLDDYISTGDSFNDIFGSTSDSFTITGWIKPKAFNAATSNHGTANTIFAKASDSNNDNLEIGVNSTGSLHIYMDAVTDFTGDIGAGITQDNWHFIAIIYDGTTLTTFINGVKSTNATPNGNFASATGSPFTIGTTLHSDTSFNGLVDEVKIFNVALSDSSISTIYTNESANKEYLGNTRTCQTCTIGYCEVNGLGEGFHIVDPDGGDDVNSYEIYCDRNSARAPRELIALPLKNDYNNFVFEDDSPSANYYSEADAAKVTEAANSFSFLQVSISGSTIEIVPSSIAEGSTNQGYFSNINLIGTPFAIDWSNTTISNCDSSKLRKGAFDQAVKIDTLDYTNGQCRVDSMRLKLLDEYQYLTFSDIIGTTNGASTGAYNSEILEETCRQIFQKVPDDATHLPTLSGASNGYFWVDPDKGGRVVGDTVTTTFRPFVAYCKYQEDIKQAWTFVMALDAKVTNSKNDIKTMTEVRTNPSVYHDTCSQLGLLFFVPNTKDTFQRTQSYLNTNKNEWINYTGSVREKYKMYTNNTGQEYYIQGEGYNEIWPYGPFGLYFPQSGNKRADGTTGVDWGDGSNSAQEYMSGRCMNSGTSSGAATCTDYSVLSPDDGTMGYVGWRTTLMDQVSAGLQGITDGDQWWVADVGAGDYLTSNNAGTPECSITSPGSNPTACRVPYYEPNGNYTQYAWLNFISDSNGNVYHNDDNNAFYSYYDYMCMSWDNYYGFSRYGLTEGPFTVIEHDNPTIDTTGGYPITTPLDLNITTKVLQEPKDFDILLLSDNRAEIVNDQNVSAGVFLVKIDESTSNGLTTNEFTDLSYYGQLGVNDDFNLASNPRGVIALSDALSTINSVHQRLIFQFKYCGYSNSWSSCWTITGSGASTKATCSTGYDSLGSPNSPCQVADSNDFAVRPDKFRLFSSDPDSAVTSTALIVKAKAVTIDYIAKDITGSVSLDYNASFSTLNTDITLINPGICATTLLEDTNQSTFQFQNGIESDTVTLSNVGEYTFVLEEIEGQEFAIVDAGDTTWANRQIEPNDMKLIIKPDHFTMTNLQNPNFNTDGNFTYLAKPTNLDNMAAKIDFDITAFNSSNGITTNYTNGCYASPVKLDVNYTVPTGEAFNLINYKVGTAASSSITVSSTLGGSFIDSATEDVPKTVFADADLGVGKIAVKFNFDRAINIAKNPFIINLNNLNVSDQTTGVLVNTTNQTINSDATFVYGRAAGPKRASFTNCVDNPTNCTSTDDSPRIVFQIYRDNLGASVPALNGASHDGTQDSRWWTSPFHDINNILSDGNITIPGNTITEVTGANVIQSALVEESNFRYRAEINYNGGDGYVKEANLKHTPSPWLIYDPDNAVATFNTFYHNFITEGWSGKNESSTTTKTKAANRTSKRILW